MKRKLLRILSVCLLALMLLSMLPAVSAADLSINSTNFPDAKFRELVKTFDKNSDGKLSAAEIGAVTEIDCHSKEIANLTGIAYFTKLQDLNATSNNLSAVDLSKNTELKYLDIGFNQLTKLDVSALTKLESMDVWANKLKTLNVSKNTLLKSLFCDSNELTSLDLSKNTKLHTLSCGRNKLTALDLSANPDLALLWCDGNVFRVLDLRKTPLLDKAYRKGTKETKEDYVKYTLDTDTEYAVLSISPNTRVYATNTTTPPNPFTDVKSGKYYYNAVLWAYWHNPRITGGVGDGTKFGINEKCTREQVVTFLWKANNSPKPKTTKSPFTDVKSGKYYYNAVLWAVENKITTGATETTFGVGKPCTREQVVTFIWKSKNSPKPAKTSNPFTDVKAGKYYTNAVLWAYYHNPRITGGTTDTLFGVGKPCTRAQIVTFLYAAYN